MNASVQNPAYRTAVLGHLAALLEPGTPWPAYDDGEPETSHPAFGWAHEAADYGDLEYSTALSSALTDVAVLAAETSQASRGFCYYFAALHTGIPSRNLGQFARRMVNVNLLTQMDVLIALDYLDRADAVDIGRSALRSQPLLQKLALEKLIGLFSPTERIDGAVDCCELLDVSPGPPGPLVRAAHFLLAARLSDGLQEALEVHLPELDPTDSAYADTHHTYLAKLAGTVNHFGVDNALAIAARRWAAASTPAPRWVKESLEAPVQCVRDCDFDVWADLDPWSSDYWAALKSVAAECETHEGAIVAYAALEVLQGDDGADAEERAVAADIIGLLAEQSSELASEMMLAEGLLAVVHDEGADLSVDATLGMSVARALGCFMWMPHCDRVDILGALAILQASRDEDVRDQALEVLTRLARPVDQVTHAIVEPKPAPAPPVAIDARWAEALELYPWQQDALQEWVDGDRRGVVEAVTGAGKTRLALAVIAEAVTHSWPVAILVPGRQLLDQWRREIEHQLQDRAGLRFSIGELHGDAADSLSSCDVLLATLQSAARYDLEPALGESVLIVDEAHRAGAPSWSAALDPRFVQRLGLTATYEREGDLGVEEHLDPFFGGVCASVGYGEALRDGVIAPFKVAYVGVRFTPSEQLEYDEVAYRAATLRHQLVADWGCPAEPFGVFLKAVHRLSASGVPEGSRLAGFYLSAFSKRRSVLSNAAGKIDRLQDLVPAVRDADKTIVFTQTKQAATEAVAALADGQIDGAVLHAGMDLDARAQVFGGFEDGTHELVAAPRLLDEGVDVPAADLGMVIAASRSRRQMIQRMGRILRRKADGRPARFVIMFVEDSSEDPNQPGHEGFLELITPHALDVKRFDGTAAHRTINDYLHPASRSVPSTAGPCTRSRSDDLYNSPEVRKQLAMALLDKGYRLGQRGRNHEEIGVYDEVIARFGDDDTPVIRGLVARALLDKGISLGETGREGEEIGVYDEVIARFGDDDTPVIRQQLAMALVNKGGRLGQVGHHEEAIEIHDEVIARFGDDDTPVIRQQLAMALVNKGYQLSQSGRREEAIGVYDEVIARFGDDDTPVIRQQLAKALVNKGITLGDSGRREEAIGVLDEVVARFGRDDTTEAREQVGEALLDKSYRLSQSGRHEDAIEVCDEVVARFGDDDATGAREQVARALINNGIKFVESGHDDEAIGAFDEVVARFGDDHTPPIREQVSRALINKGCRLSEGGRPEDALEVCDELIARLGGDHTPPIRKQLAQSLLIIGFSLGKSGRNDEAIEVYGEVVARFGDDRSKAVRELVAQALTNKGGRLLEVDRDDEAIEVYGEVVARFGDDHSRAVRELVGKALLAQIYPLLQGGRNAEAIRVCDQLVACFGDDNTPTFREAVNAAQEVRGALG